MTKWAPPQNSHSPNASRALIVFVKRPDPGRVKTRLAREIGDTAAAEIYRRLTEATVRSAYSPESQHACKLFFDPPDAEADIRQWLVPQESGITFHPQIGRHLGERMAHAFHEVFGDAKVQETVIIGTDCPGLDQTRIQSAFDLLEEHDIVLGPAFDGGYYLLGMRACYPWLFDNISWSTSLVLSQTLDAIRRRKLNCAALPVLRDIDTKDDLEALWPNWSQEL